MGKPGDDAQQVEETRPMDAGNGSARRRKRLGMLHRTFELTLLLKGIHAGLEIVGAALSQSPRRGLAGRSRGSMSFWSTGGAS